MVYRIKDWIKHFEGSETRRNGNGKTERGQVRHWVKLPTKQGDGYATLLDHPDGAAHFGCWVAIVEIANNCDPRGTLVKKTANCQQNVAHSPESLGRIARIPVTLMEAALARLVEQVGWIERVDILPTDCQQNAADLRQNVSVFPITGQDRTGQDSTLRGDEFAADLAFEKIWLAYPKKGRTKRPVAESNFTEVILPAADRPALAAEILAAVEGKWKTSKLWGDGFIPGLDRFLYDQRWREDPEQAAGGDEDRIPEYRPDWMK